MSAIGTAQRLAVALVTVLVAGACTGGDANPAPTPKVPPTPVTHRLEPGIQVELTAVVARVFGANAFLVADADLPPDGQIVVSDAPVVVLPTELVSVSGRTAVLGQPALQRYGVSDARVVESDGGVAIVASTIRRYLPASPTPDAQSK